MKIAFICTQKLPSPAVEGGAIQILIDGVKNYLAKNHEMTIYSITHPKLPQNEITDGIRYIRFPSGTYLGDVARDIRKRSGEFDVIHVFNRPYNVPFFKRSSPKSRIVVSLHNEMFRPDKLTDNQGIASLAATHRILTVSNFIAQTVTARFPQAKTKVRTIYSGVDLEQYPPVWSARGQKIRENMRYKYNVQGKTVITYVGRLSNKKGVHVLIQAFLTLAKERKDVVLAIVGSKWFGDNTEDKYVKMLKKLSAPIQDRMIFTGFVNPRDIHRYYLMGDIFVCASQWEEPLARVHYEAMAAGIPIITTSRGGNPEVIDNGVNGVVIKNYSQPEAFARAIRRLINDSSKAQNLAHKARYDAETRFSFARVARELEQHYYDVMGMPNKINLRRLRLPVVKTKVSDKNPLSAKSVLSEGKKKNGR
ncbi:MAG: glycosyltransferase family 4 protein [Chitinophagales bacterium]